MAIIDTKTALFIRLPALIPNMFQEPKVTVFTGFTLSIFHTRRLAQDPLHLAVVDLAVSCHVAASLVRRSLLLTRVDMLKFTTLSAVIHEVSTASTATRFSDGSPACAACLPVFAIPLIAFLSPDFAIP